MVNDKIKAVHDDDLSDLLISLDVYSDFDAGTCACSYCGAQMNFSNLIGIFPHDNEIGFCCDKIDCRLMMMGFATREEKADAIV